MRTTGINARVNVRFVLAPGTQRDKFHYGPAQVATRAMIFSPGQHIMLEPWPKSYKSRLKTRFLVKFNHCEVLYGLMEGNKNITLSM